MTSITIRNLDEQAKARLCVRAAHRKRSMADEARNILRAPLYARIAVTRRKAGRPISHFDAQIGAIARLTRGRSRHGMSPTSKAAA